VIIFDKIYTRIMS